MAGAPDETTADLHLAWQEALRAVGADLAAGERVFAELVAAYGAPTRFYHNLDHLRSVLAALAWLSGAAHDRTALRLAAWFHDAVYDSQAPDNEGRSAAWAEVSLRSLGVPAETLAAVRRLILLTKAHRAEAGDSDGQVLLDADLTILGAPAEAYHAYAQAIRREYAWVAEDAYRAGRARVLRGFLKRERIYGTAAAFKSLEAAARRNLQSELRALESGG